jgi:hypothetical protein
LYRFLAIAVFDVETYLKSDRFVGGGSHILSGLWVFYRDSQFQNPYAGGTEFGPAIDGSWVEALGIKNDDMSSLRSVE